MRHGCAVLTAISQWELRCSQPNEFDHLGTNWDTGKAGVSLRLHAPNRAPLPPFRPSSLTASRRRLSAAAALRTAPARVTAHACGAPPCPLSYPAPARPLRQRPRRAPRGAPAGRRHATVDILPRAAGPRCVRLALVPAGNRRCQETAAAARRAALTRSQARAARREPVALPRCCAALSSCSPSPPPPAPSPAWACPPTTPPSAPPSPPSTPASTRRRRWQTGAAPPRASRPTTAPSPA